MVEFAASWCAILILASVLTVILSHRSARNIKT